MIDDRLFDVIVVGAGPAGCVMAARLTEDAGRRVLLVEAGPDYGPDPAAWPPELLNPYATEWSMHTWGYHNAAAPGSGLDRGHALPRARVFGGSSAINACQWYRGSRIDYDGWRDASNPGWGWDDLFPYFLKCETDDEGDTGWHGHDGPVRIFREPEDRLTTSDWRLIETAQEFGYSWMDDLNGAGSDRQTPAIGRTPKNIDDGVRLNGALTHLAMARGRPNLTLLPDTLVDRVVFDDGCATGVQTSDGRLLRGREVVLAAGAYASPAILLRSGVGPARHLAELGIPLVREMPGVGEHLLDHPYISPYTSNLILWPIRPGMEAGRRVFVQVMMRARSNQVDREIDLHLYPREIPDGVTGGWLFGFGISLMHARSKGRVRLTGPDLEAPLDIDHRWFSDDEGLDLEALADGVQLAYRLVTTAPLSEMLDVSDAQRRLAADREAIRGVLRREASTTFHPSSTCRMGPAHDPTAVVDAEGRVHGLAGLRVVDASIFPWGPRCNLHAPVVAVAEKLAHAMRAAG